MDKLILRTDMAATMSRLGNIIRNSGYTDRDISEIIGISVQSVNKWRHGYSFPDVENLYTLSRILGISVDEIFVAGRNDYVLNQNYYCETGNPLGMKMRIMAYYWMMRGAYICHKNMKGRKEK